MILSGEIFPSSNSLRLRDYPHALVSYQKQLASTPSIHFQIVDESAQKAHDVIVEEIALQRIGLSTTALKALQNNPEELPDFLLSASLTKGMLEKAALIAATHLPPQHLQFFRENIAFANQMICHHIEQQTEHISKVPGVPGIYIYLSECAPEIFINLKGVEPIGFGSFCKVRKTIWLTAPTEKEMLVAKKVLQNKNSREDTDHFDREISILQEFSNQRGIISLICGGIFNNKRAMFLPLYACALDEYFENPFPLTIMQKINIATQWVQGLAAIAKKGTHGDLSLGNFLLKCDAKGNFKSVISDFGTFRPAGEEEYGHTTPSVAPPEYYARSLASPKQDVWALGLAMHQLFCARSFQHWDYGAGRMAIWTASLKPDWSKEYPLCPDTPFFYASLVNDMLHPDPILRPPAEVVLDRYMEGRAAFLADKKKDRLKRKESTSSVSA